MDRTGGFKTERKCVRSVTTTCYVAVAVAKYIVIITHHVAVSRSFQTSLTCGALGFSFGKFIPSVAYRTREL